MDILQKIRVIIAAMLSPLIVPLLIDVTLSLLYDKEIRNGDAIQSSITTATWLSYAIVLFTSAIVYFWLRAKQYHNVRAYLLAGICIGFISWLLFSLFSMTAVILLFFIYLLAGLLLGSSFWLLAYFQPNGNYSQRASRRRKRRSM
ncbi:MAG: hypothetical protein GXP08_10785 [Gammaproteobacteria bacterium]|nr:hypothetical protein [Gammaproteobacteria bacterium]